MYHPRPNSSIPLQNRPSTSEDGRTFFDDAASLGHAALGALAARSPGTPGAAIAVLFLIYQAIEPEPAANKIGDLAEFAAGYAAALTIR
jgi:hypothetical protein